MITSFVSKPRLQDSIDATRMRIKRMRVKMKGIRDSLVLKDLTKALDELYEYQKLNDELRKAKIYEAELVHLRNQL
jgi:predicted  nucleic acid-binding Zn-ribbon protein